MSKNIFSRAFIKNIREIYEENCVFMTEKEAKEHCRIFLEAVLRTFFDGHSKIKLEHLGTMYILERDSNISIAFRVSDYVRKQLKISWPKIKEKLRDNR